MDNKIKVIECPRDAMQGIERFIPTTTKIDYLNALLEVGFHTIDFGSFVSPKAVPQMSDTSDLLPRLKQSSSQLLAIVANLRGAETAITHERIRYIGYPLSVSETFQLKNSNKTIVQSLEELVVITEKCQKANKKLVVYLSMGFGNPYDDPYEAKIVAQFADILISLGVQIISISDTVGLASPKEIEDVFKTVASVNNKVEWGLHLHANPKNAEDKVRAALNAGCRRLDGAILGFGGCPFAKDELVGNLNTRNIIQIASEMGYNHDLDIEAFTRAEELANTVFNQND